jgi:hypothetical protein
MRRETPIRAITTLLPARYGYTPMTVYDALPAFAAELTPQQLASLRCEGSVLFIGSDAVSVGVASAHPH